MRIRTRIFLATAILVSLAVVLAVSAATWRAQSIADRTVREDLSHVPQLFASFRGNLERLIRDKLRSIAGEPGTKALFASADSATRWEFAGDTAELHGARTVFLFGRDSAVMARSDKPVDEGLGQPFASVRWVSDVLDNMRDSSAAIREGDTLSLVAAVPVFAGDELGQGLLGVLAATFPLDDPRAAELKELSRGEVGFLRNVAKRDAAPRLEVAASTPGLNAAGLTAALAADPALTASLIEPLVPGTVTAHDVTVDGDARLLVGAPILSAAGEPLGAVVVSRSRSEAIAAFHQIRTTLLGVGVLALIAALPVSLFIGRGIARPIEQLASCADAIRDGRLDVELPAAASGEVGALAEAFGRFVEELREKAALELLVGDVEQREATRRSQPVPASTTAQPARDPGSLAVGDMIASRYRIQSIPEFLLLGPLYRATDTVLEREVDLQFVGTGVAGAEASEVEREVARARRILHSNVVTIRDYVASDGLRFLVLEHNIGGSLRRLIERLGGGLALQPGLQIAKQMLRGLAAIHEADSVHLHLNPQNITVLPNGVVKLMHVAIASSNERDDSPYRSPERAAGGAATARADLYAAGMVMFEIFTGMKPVFEPGTIPRPSSFRPGLPASLDRIVTSCLADDPEGRPANADAVYGALMRITG